MFIQRKHGNICTPKWNALKNVPLRGSWEQCLTSNPSCLLYFRATDSQALLRNVQRWAESVLKSEKQDVCQCLSATARRPPLFKGQPSIVFGSSCTHPSDINGSVRLKSFQTWRPHMLDFLDLDMRIVFRLRIRCNENEIVF